MENINNTDDRYNNQADELVRNIKKLDIKLRYNTLLKKTEIYDTDTKFWRGYEKSDLVSIKVNLLRNKYKTSIYLIDEVLSCNEFWFKTHPIIDYIESCGTKYNNPISYERFSAALNTKLSNETQSFLFKWWLMGSVARLYDTQKQLPVLTFEGEQSIGKSGLVKWLAKSNEVKDYSFAIKKLEPEDDQCMKVCCENWIIELSEMNTTTKGDVDALKRHLTSDRFRFRKKYDRDTVIMNHIASYIGTTNAIGSFLYDQTGNRRFIVVPIESIDWTILDDLNPDELWGFIYNEYIKYGFEDVIEDKYQDELNPIKNQYVAVVHEEEFFKTIFEKTDNKEDIIKYVDIMNIFKENNMTISSNKLASIIARMGIIKKRTEKGSYYTNIRRIQ